MFICEHLLINALSQAGDYQYKIAWHHYLLSSANKQEIKPKNKFMKKLFFAALLALSFLTTSLASDVNKISPGTLQKFSTEFRGAKDITWTSAVGYSRALFTFENERMEVYYDLSDNLLGTVKKINLEELPTNAKRVFAKTYSDYTVKEAIRFDGVEEGAYFISAENTTRSIVLKVTDSGLVSIFLSRPR